ncbi:hypothetical protein ACH4PU_12345 [Streptomyces sp. NPDC021100]|uniref:hypothetical protein n=1 Tax=Streptomyces sp. NPDC021100 TaxID=3365114 RepID=UPI0037B6E3FE
MGTVRQFVAAVAASAALTLGSIALATPAQADDTVLRLPGLAPGTPPILGRALNPIDAIGPVFAVPSEGVRIAGDAVNSRAGSGGGGGKLLGLLPGL